MTIFRGIQAVDRDKPNTANSEIMYAITRGNEAGKFALEVGPRPQLVLKRPLDFDTGDRHFRLTLLASVSLQKRTTQFRLKPFLRYGSVSFQLGLQVAVVPKWGYSYAYNCTKDFDRK